MAERTLVVVLCEARAAELTWERVERHLLRPLGADLAVCIAAPVSFDYLNPFYLHAKYRWLTPEYDDWGDAWDAAARSMGAGPEWRQLLDIGGHWLGGIKGPKAQPSGSALLFWFRWFMLEQVKAAGLLSQYDRFIVTRSDYLYEAPHPPMETLDPRHIWVPDGEDYLGLCDRHIVVSAADFVPAMSLIEPLLRDPAGMAARMGFRDYWNIEQYIHLYFGQIGLLQRVRRYPWVMFTVRTQHGASRWSTGSESEEIDGKFMWVKYPQEREDSAFVRPLLQTTVDWHDFLHWKAYFANRFAYRMLETGNHAAAIQLLDTAVETNAALGPAADDGFQTLWALTRSGDLLAEADRVTEAIARYRLAVALKPQLGHLQLRLAALLQQAGAADEAHRGLADALAAWPDDASLKAAIAALAPPAEPQPPDEAAMVSAAE